MNLGQAAIRIRERTAVEVLDLSFLFLKSRAVTFGALALFFVAPVSYGAWWLIGLSRNWAGQPSWYVTFVVVVTAATLVRGPTLILCGQAMFDERSTLRKVLPDIFRQLGSVLGLVVWRFALSVTVVGLFFDGMRNYFRDEVLLLERPGAKEARERMTYLRRRFGPDGREQAAYHLVLTGAFVASGWSVWLMTHLLVTSEAELNWWPASPAEPALILSFLLAQVYLATAKFLYYLNLRTVNEGWDLFLETRSIQAELDRRRDAGRRDVASVGIALVAALLLGSLSAPAEADDDAQREVKRVLEQGRYPWYDPDSDGPNFELLREQLEPPALEEQGKSWIAWILNGIALVILVGVLVYLLRLFLESRRRPLPAPDLEDAPAAPLVPFEDPVLGTDAMAWLRSARERAAAGDFASAIVHLFNHQLLELDRTGRIHLGPGRTNRHHLEELAEAGSGRLHFRSTIRVFESIFFGGRSADRETYERFEKDHERLLAGSGTKEGA